MGKITWHIAKLVGEDEQGNVIEAAVRLQVLSICDVAAGTVNNPQELKELIDYNALANVCSKAGRVVIDTVGYIYLLGDRTDRLDKAELANELDLIATWHDNAVVLQQGATGDARRR